MPVTVDYIKAKLTVRIGRLLSDAEVVIDGAAIEDAILVAATFLEIPLADDTVVTDADLAAFELKGFNLLRFLDFAELRLLEDAWSFYASSESSFSAGNLSMSGGTSLGGIEARIKYLAAKLAKPYTAIDTSVPGPSAFAVMRTGRAIPNDPTRPCRPRPGTIPSALPTWEDFR